MLPSIESLETRQLLASIAGRVFNDINANKIKDGSEVGLSGRTVYVDQNNNKKLDASERKVTTDGAGNYKISSLSAGNHLVRQVLPAGWSQTTPSGGLAIHATLTTSQNVTGKNFGARAKLTDP